jgi:hypothetical protein
MSYQKFLSRLAWMGSAVVFLGGSLSAQQESSRFIFDIGGGFSQTVGNTGRYLDNGWNIGGGAGFNFSSYVGAKIDLGYNQLGINSTTLSNVGVPGGNIGVFSTTLDPIVHLAPGHHVDVYLIGGGGLFHVREEYTQPSATIVTGFSPFVGFYSEAVPSTDVLASYTVNKPGIDAGAGLAIGTKWHGKIFAESRYNRIYLGANRHEDYIPVAFGFRW